MLWKREPALFYALVNSLIALVVAFGLSLTADQIGTILAVTSALLGLLTRTQVTPTASPPAPVEPPVEDTPDL